MDQFTYLGSAVSISGGPEEDITAHFGKARSAFAWLKPDCVEIQCLQPRNQAQDIQKQRHTCYMERNAGE